MSETPPEVSLFDANCALGMVAQPGPAGAFLAADELLEHQARYGITRALSYHSLALEEHPATGNAKLLSAIEGHEALLPSWIALPHHTGEFPEPATLLSEARSAGVRALRLFPDAQRYPVDDWMLGDFFAAVAGQVPLFWHIDRLNTPTARDIYRVCTEYPQLQVVVCDVEKSIPRIITPLLRRLPNLWLETGGFRTYRGIEFIAEAVGSERLIFGTRLPWQSAGGPHAELLYARLEPAVRAQIGSDNLDRLLETAAW
ncbi:MAG: hypothetical protein CL878_08200 [Dehalococcoidia bacterium]|nr:hypothetical protein [Dehalococcoidia bacterium]